MLNNIINNFNTQLTPSPSKDWLKSIGNISQLPQASIKKSTNSFSKFIGKAGDELKWLGQDVGDLTKTAGLTSTGSIAGVGEMAYGITDSLIKQPDMIGVEDKVVSGLTKGAWKMAGVAPNPYTIGAAAILSGFDLANKSFGENLNSDETQDMVNTGYANFSANDLLKEGGKGKKGTLWSKWFHKGRTRDQNARIDFGKKANILASDASYLNKQNTLASQNTIGVLYDKYYQQKMGGTDTRMLAAKKGAKIPPAKFRSIIEKAQKGIKIKEPILEKENFEDYRKRIGKLNPSFLKDDPYYNLRGAFEGGLEPELNEEDGTYHLGSRNPKTGEILKRPGHPTWDLMLKGEEEAGYEVYQEGDKWFSRKKKKYKDGGLFTKGDKKEVIKEVAEEKVNIIPNGAFHSRKNNLPDEIAKNVTHKGIPVIVKDGNKITQIAEIERSEIVFNKTVSEKIENYLKDYNEAETQKKKDKIAIECGKLISDQIINNTIDNVGLLNKE